MDEDHNEVVFVESNKKRKGSTGTHLDSMKVESNKKGKVYIMFVIMFLSCF